jgi:Zn-dependent protease
LAGLFLALIYMLIFYFTKTQDAFLLAKGSIILSLLNLIPLQPLDGGKIAEALSPKLCYFGFPILIYLFVNNDRLKSRVMIIMIMIVGFFMTLEYERKRKKRKYYNIDKKTKLKYIVLYGLLVVILFVLAICLN